MTNIVTEMVTIYCYKCGIAFCVTKDFDTKKLEHRDQNFYCPEGHEQHYIGKSDLDKMKEKLRRSELETEQAEKALKSQKKYTKEVEKQRAAFKGVVTRTKNRISKGVCPCCNRLFKNMQRHMETKHPDYAEKKDE